MQSLAPALHALRTRLTSPRARRVYLLTVLTLTGAWLGLLLAGNYEAPVGPVQTRMSFEPSLHGDTRVDIAPLGDLTIDSHDGPLALQIDITRINADDTRALFNDPRALNGLEDQIVSDVRHAFLMLVLRAVVAATVGAILVTLLMTRVPRRALVSGASALAVLAATGVAGGLTWSPRSIAEPKYTGLLSSAPSVVGNAESIVDDFGRYREELAKLVTNVSQLYDVTSTLPSYEDDGSTTRVLHVSDIHLNPAAWDVMRSVVKQFKVDMVIDSGDLTDHGTAAENRFVDELATMGVPYIYVRGNHDSMSTQEAVGAQSNAVVLDGQVEEVDGVRVIGGGDPRFTPNRSVEASGEGIVAATGYRLAERAQAESEPLDIAVVHDPAAAKSLDGEVPLVLSGHTHRRSTEIMSEGTRKFIQGSTGGAGLRALEGDEPTPIQMSVLYLDKETNRLEAWDDIDVGGLGLSSAEISRHVPDPDEQTNVLPDEGG